MSSPSAELTRDIAAHFAGVALGHVAREYPNKMDHVLDGPADVRGPRDLHPIFFGSFDWHSCVHGYWTLATLRRLHPEMPQSHDVAALFATSLTPEKVEAERAYLDRPGSRGFERPYGWAWLLMLQAELLRHEDQAWAATLQPLATAFAERLAAFLPNATYPVRTGVHNSTAFALALAADYAKAIQDQALEALLRQTARRWYGDDRQAAAWEPSGDDFLSPTLMEAEAMRRLLPHAEFQTWFAAFLPHAADGFPASLFRPATVSDRTDGKIAHLDGLNLSRAWCWRSLAASLEENNPLRTVAAATADRHLTASLPLVAGDYMGEHWLASFALLALTAGQPA